MPSSSIITTISSLNLWGQSQLIRMVYLTCISVGPPFRFVARLVFRSGKKSTGRLSWLTFVGGNVMLYIIIVQVESVKYWLTSIFSLAHVEVLLVIDLSRGSKCMTLIIG